MTVVYICCRDITECLGTCRVCPIQLVPSGNFKCWDGHHTSRSCVDNAVVHYDTGKDITLLQATTSLFFLAIAYTDALGIVALILLEYGLLIMGCMFLHLANFKGRQVRMQSPAQLSRRRQFTSKDLQNLFLQTFLVKRNACLQFVYVQLLQRKVLLDLTAVKCQKSKLMQAIVAAVIFAFGLFIGTFFDTNGATRGTTAAAFAAISSLLMVALKQKTYLQQEKTLLPLNFVMQARMLDSDL